MDISVNTKFPFEEMTAKYSYTWTFGGDSLGKVFTFHELINRSLISSEIRFDSGILAQIPHRMKIFICKKGEICVHFCINKGSATALADLDQNNYSKILNIDVFCAVNSSDKFYVFQQLKDDTARSRINFMARLKSFQKMDFIRHKDETEYLFIGSHMPNAPPPTYCGITIPGTKLPLTDYISTFKNKITEFIFKLDVSHIQWSGDQLIEENIVVSGSGHPHPPKRQRIDANIKNGLQTEEFFLSTKFSDFIIQCEGISFPVHKIIIETKSDVFERMLQEPFQEQTEGRLVLQEDPEIVKEFLRYLYTGKVNKIEENAFDLFLMADKYNVKDLKLLSENALVSAVASDNFIKIYNLGKLVNSKALMFASYGYFERNSSKLIKTPEAIKEFSNECPDLVFLYFKNSRKY